MTSRIFSLFRKYSVDELKPNLVPRASCLCAIFSVIHYF